MREAEFGSAVGLVRWHYGKGRARMGGLKAIEYEPRGGGTRDYWRMKETWDLFMLTTKCLAAVSEVKRLAVLEAAYFGGQSDAFIAEQQGVSDSTIRRSRNRGLRQVEDEARRLTGVALEQLGRPLLEPAE